MPNKVSVSDFDGNKSEIRIDKLIWRPSAYAIIIDQGKLLLLKQTNGYDLPGGGIDLGEMPEQAVVREVSEETGVSAINPRLVGVASSFYKPFNTTDKYVQSLMIYYVCDFGGGKLSKQGFDESEQRYALSPEWYDVRDIDNLKIGTSIDFRDYVKQVISA